MIEAQNLIAGHFFGGACNQSVGKQPVVAPYTGHTLGFASEGGREDLQSAIDAAHEAFPAWSRSPRHERQGLLRRVASAVRMREEELVRLLSQEVGKPLAWSQGEVARLAITFDLAADLLSGYGLEALPVDFDPRGADYRCTVERFPLGVILCIVPYNWPFNLAAHKLAPALATGNTVVLKPSQQAPLSTLTLAKIVHEAGCPPGVLNAVNVPGRIAGELAADPKVKMVSFTGSPAVGWALKKSLSDKRVSLELGGNASAIVCADADLDEAAERIALGAYGYAGQVCIAVQHVLVEAAVYPAFCERLIRATERCPAGDPLATGTVCGPLIDEDAARKIESWIDEAIQAGARRLAGGERRGALVPPTLLEEVPGHTRLACQEVFGPVLTVAPFERFSEALERVNRSEYGIHCGVFTRDLRLAEEAFRTLEVGGVIVGDYPTLRFDNMPYGGVKKSGFGREGVRYAMDEMTEPKTLLVKVR